MKFYFITLIVFLLNVWYSFGQISSGSIQGDIQIEGQWYQPDSLIGAPDVPEKFRMNAYMNLIYSTQNFNTGMRFEAYQNPLIGYDPRWKGQGIAARWAQYKHEQLEFTVGTFYEQFGSGMILRFYEDRQLGIDNALDGIRVRLQLHNALTTKALIGKQRFFFDRGEGIVRGVDAELQMNELHQKWQDKKLRIIFGGSFVSKYQPDRDPIYVLPENVAAFAGRANISYQNLFFQGEYVHKINDPSATNRNIYKEGQALYLNLTYARKGLSAMISAKRIDNMDFRSDRTATGNILQINYLPALTIPHTYTLPALYPYVTQPNGEMGIQSLVTFKIPKKTKFGGPFGTNITLHFSQIHDIVRLPLNDTTPIGKPGTLGYTSPFFQIGNEIFYRDASVSIDRKFSSKFKLQCDYIYTIYNKEVIEGHEGDIIYAHSGVVDMLFTINKLQRIRTEVQHLYTKQDHGNWAMMLIEYLIVPKWSFAIKNAWNYGNQAPEQRVHYYGLSLAYTHQSTRIALSYGKEQEGIICVGGVCRYNPASYGARISITSNF